MASQSRCSARDARTVVESTSEDATLHHRWATASASVVIPGLYVIIMFFMFLAIDDNSRNVAVTDFNYSSEFFRFLIIKPFFNLILREAMLLDIF